MKKPRKTYGQIAQDAAQNRILSWSQLSNIDHWQHIARAVLREQRRREKKEIAKMFNQTPKDV